MIASRMGAEFWSTNRTSSRRRFADLYSCSLDFQPDTGVAVQSDTAPLVYVGFDNMLLYYDDVPSLLWKIETLTKAWASCEEVVDGARMLQQQTYCLFSLIGSACNPLISFHRASRQPFNRADTSSQASLGRHQCSISFQVEFDISHVIAPHLCYGRRLFVMRVDFLDIS